MVIDPPIQSYVIFAATLQSWMFEVMHVCGLLRIWVLEKNDNAKFPHFYCFIKMMSIAELNMQHQVRFIVLDIAIEGFHIQGMVEVILYRIPQ